MGAQCVESLMASGNEAFEQRNYHKALQKYQQILDFDPKHREAYTCATQTSFKLRDYRQTLSIITKGLEHFPQDKDLLVVLGFVHVQLNEKAKAAAIYEQLKKVHPDKAEELYKAIYR